VGVPEGLAKPALGNARGSGGAQALRSVGRFVRRKPLGALGGFIVIALLVMAVFAEQLAPYGYDETVRGSRMKPPSAAHWLGTDNLSRDMWSRIVFGARVSVTVGVATVALAVFLATAVGVFLAGFAAIYWQLHPARKIKNGLAPVLHGGALGFPSCILPRQQSSQLGRANGAHLRTTRAG